MRLAACLIVVALAGEGPCSGVVAPATSAPVPGAWGGAHAALTLSDSGGTIEYDCAHGTLGVLRTDAVGRFDVAGTHVREHGGPVRVDDTIEAQPARYVGQVTATVMTLRVQVGPDTLGPFELVRGKQPQLFKCL